MCLPRPGALRGTARGARSNCGRPSYARGLLVALSLSQVTVRTLHESSAVAIPHGAGKLRALRPSGPETCPMITRRTRADALRVLAMDAVQRANSGHPGAPMGMADMAEALWCGPLKHHPEVPSWFDRDRFVLSNGHASMLLYGLLHLSGYEVSTEDLKNFRQHHAPTAGHPEYGELPGVETTTGPLGQGVAMAVGMALAEKVLAAASIAQTSPWSIITPMFFWGMAASWRAFPRKPSPSLEPLASAS